ncbi:putative zinc finger protein [Pseudonocardia hierapolitana]|uniref:Putative zinc finger protein n=1 Tax=Pseudonocardia hierapolitana TaxID=1128676 RepID=A0A561SNC8_9PSEU|nr:zf-HC2 domain-containing protein [Pseudonocardia hierapolitana]TWF76363.1 putative zinc finger protein [Pseudonocardia hierapolitana]
MSSGRWRISVTTPDWGHDHLSSDAIVAYVDDELAPGPHLRANQHLSQCPECAAQVVAQGQARAALRTAGCPSLPSSLLSSLRSIPQDTDLPAPPAGLAVTPEGQFVSVLRPERAARGAARTDSAAPHGDRTHRRMWLGTGVAVTGLAAGAIAFAVPAAVTGSAAPDPGDADTARRPVLGGTATPVDVRLQLTPQPAAATSAPPSVAPTSAPPAAGDEPR